MNRPLPGLHWINRQVPVSSRETFPTLHTERLRPLTHIRWLWEGRTCANRTTSVQDAGQEARGSRGARKVSEGVVAEGKLGPPRQRSAGRPIDPLTPSHRPPLQIKDLNSGTFGFVQLVLDKTTGRQVAIKFIERGDKVCRGDGSLEVPFWDEMPQGVTWFWWEEDWHSRGGAGGV